MRELLRTIQPTPRVFAIGGFLAFLLLGGIWYWQVRMSLAVSDSVMLTTQLDWEAGEYWNRQLDTRTVSGSLSIGEGGVGTWEASTPSFPENIRGRFDLGQEPADIGADLTTDGTYVYMIIGGHVPGFFRYNPETNTWRSLTQAPTEFYYGSSITYEDGYVYASVGHHDGTTATDASKKLLRYDIKEDSWSFLADAPDTWGRGADLKSGRNGKLYALQGELQSSFWIYDIEANTWSDGPSTPDPISTANNHPMAFSDASFGADPVYCESGCLYSFAGANRSFFRYDISLGQWYSGFADVPAAIGNITTGSALIADPVNDDLYAFRGGATTFFKYDIGDPGTWDSATTDTENSQRSITNGASLVYLNGYIYGTPGGVPEIMRYNIATGHWDSILSQNAVGTNADGLIVYVPDNVTAGCTDTDGCLFVAQGGGTGLRRFDLTSRTWSAALTAIPGALGAGASMCFDGTNTVYIARGSTGTQIYPYSISGNSYGSTITSPGALGGGASITCTDTNEFYLLRGNNTNSYYYYNGSSIAADDNLPVTASLGGALANDGTYVYALAGNNRGNFYRFDPAQGSGSRWTALPILPTSSYYTASLEDDGAGHLYAIPGQYQRDFWHYDINAQTWNRASDLPQRFGYSHGLAHDDANDRMYILRGGAPSTNSLSVHLFTTDADDYIPSATWISAPLDISYASSYTDFIAGESTPGSTSVTYWMRTSDDKASWSDWDEVTDNSLDSEVERYVQFKIILQSDDDNTPSVDSITLTYEKDSTAPSNPTATGYTDRTKVSGISSPASTYATNPYFEFSGSTDAHSEVEGYYVAWTTSNSFDPSSSEDYFQTGTTYEVHTALTAGTTYYLRVAARDIVDNTATPTTAFQYTYTGISPAANKSWSSTIEFDAGTLSNMDSAGNELELSAVTDGAWTTEAALPTTVSNGASISFDGSDTFYILRGTNTQTLWSYSLSNKTYATLANYGANVTTGATAMYIPAGPGCVDDTGCLYATRGNGQTAFQRYNVSGNAGAGTTANSWSTMTALPMNGGTGGAMAYDGNNTIYMLIGSTAPGTRFYKYSISGNSWAQLPDTDQTIGLGGTLVFVPNGAGCSDALGCLFATRGNNDTDYYKFRIQANSWSYAANIPIWFGDGASARRVGNYIYYSRATVSNGFYRYDLANDVWEQLPSAPTNQYQGSEQGLSYVESTNSLYVFRGYAETSLFRYDITNSTWENTPGLPHQYTSAGMQYGAVAFDPGGAGTDDDKIYAARGNNFPDWWGYTPSTDTWMQLSDIPKGVYIGSDAEYVNHGTDSYDGIYLMVGNETLGDNVGYFYRFDTQLNQWTRLSDLPGEPGGTGGSDLVYDGVNTLYTAQGGSTSYYKYTISTDSWSTVVSTIPNGTSSGSCAEKINVGGTDYIYLTRGGNQRNVYRFNIGTETWDAAATVEDAPAGINTPDTCFADGLGNILFPRGASTTDMYVLDPDGDANGVWSTRSVPQPYANGSLVMTSNNVVMGFRGASTSAMNRYVVATPSTGFAGFGTWISEIVDFGAGTYKYAGLSYHSDEVENADLTIETRTCADAGCAADDDHASWGAWTDVSDQRSIGGVGTASIVSSVARYGQVRVTMNSDQVFTPTLQDISWQYYIDATAPTNPESANGYTDSSKATAIPNDTWSADTTPYFEWTASDNSGGIGIEGTHVYFGTNSGLDPVDDADDATNLAYKDGTNFYAVNGAVGTWNAATQSASALTSGTYYLKIKLQDLNDNISATAATVFTFKLDVTNPSNPTGVTANPAGYSAVNSFDFTWTASSDPGGGSGVDQYCWKIEDEAETCFDASATNVDDVQAIQTRANTFYVRARDEAGNYSAYGQTVFYYAGDPPTAPQNLVVTPESAENTNAFSFSWSLPASCLGQTPCVAGDIIRYCYTINELPSEGNCGSNIGGNPTPSPDGGWTTANQTSNRLLPAFAAASIQGENTLYLVAADAINNIDYGNYVTVNYDFSSTAPGPPGALQAQDTSDRSTNRFSITLTWDEPTEVGSGVEVYKIYRCESDCENPDQNDDPPENYTNIASTTTLGYLDTSLDTTKTYTYFVRAIGPGNAASGNSAVVAKRPEGKFRNAPLMSGQPTVDARIRGATIQWLTLNDTGQDGSIIEHKASSLVLYGITTAYGDEVFNSELVNEHEVTLSNLTPDTLYHYKLKWTDIDGNVGESGDFTFQTKGAPSAPTNLAADPESNTANRFTFSWDPPTDEGVTISGYYYSVNNVPTIDNVRFTADTSVGPFAAATQQGTNTFYVVAVDDGGNVNYASYAAVNFEANTTPPGPPSNITIVDSSNRDAERYNITLTWDPPQTDANGNPLGGTQEEVDVTYAIYRSEDEGETYESIATLTSTGFLDTGLNSEITYMYKVTAQDSAGAQSVATDEVAEKPEGRYTTPPEITIAPIVTPDSFSATVTWETERPTSSFVQFGNSATSLAEEQGTGDLVTEHSVKITGLQPTSNYFYRIKVIDIDENENYSEPASFTTLEAPRVSDVEITDIRLYDAVITWKTNKETTSGLIYGTTTDYGLSRQDTSGSYSFTHTMRLENLSDGTTYNVQLAGVDKSGNPVASDNYTFTTLTFPRIENVSWENIAEGQTEVEWTTNVPTDSTVVYYNETTPTKTQGNTALVTDHTVLLFGLNDATVYQFVIKGLDQFSNRAESPEAEFRTLEDTTPPVISNVKVESNTIGAGDASRVQIIVSFRTNEPTSTQVLYGQGSSGTTQETEINGELVYDHLMVIQDLDPARTYVVKAVAVDKAGNRTESDVYTVLTSRARESFLQLIIANLEDTFAWLGNLTPG